MKPIQMPRFSALAIHVCAALYGYNSDRVQHMVRRNDDIAARKAFEALA